MVIASIFTSLRESRKAMAIRSSLPASVSIMTGLWAARLAASRTIRKQLRKIAIHHEYMAVVSLQGKVFNHHDEARIAAAGGDRSFVGGIRFGGGCQRQMEGGVHHPGWAAACQHSQFQGGRREADGH